MKRKAVFYSILSLYFPFQECHICTEGCTNLYLMPLIFRTTTRVNNEKVLPGSADSRIADRLAEIRLVSEKWAAFITVALSTSPRAHKHRHVHSAWMSRCKHLSCLSRPRRHSLVVHLSVSLCLCFSPPVLESICAHHYLALCSESWQNVPSCTSPRGSVGRFAEISCIKIMVAAFEPWADCHFKIKDTKNKSKALKSVQETDCILRHMVISVVNSYWIEVGFVGL